MSGRWDVPGHWSWCKARDIASIVGGGTPPSSDVTNFSDDGTPWITPADLSGYQETYISRGRRSLSRAGYEASAARSLPAGTVMLSSRAPIGYCVIARVDMATNQGFKSFVCRQGVQPEFLRHYLLNSRDYLESLASGTTFKELSGSRTEEIEIPLPPVAEQHRIVAKLDDLLARSRRAKEELAAIPALLERYRQSVLAAAFRGDLTADWRAKNPEVEPASRSLQQHGIDARTTAIHDTVNAFPPGWATIPLRELTTKVTSGSRAWSRYYDRGNAVFVLAQNVRNTGLEFRSTQLVDPPEDDPERERTRIELGDVLVTIVGANTGDCCDVRQALLDHYVCQSVALIRPIAPDMSRWISMFVQRSVAEGGSLSGDIYGAARPHLALDHLRNLVIPIPPPSEMTRVLELFEQWEISSRSLQDGCKQHSRQIDELERAILTRAFRGELVPQDPNDEPASELLARIRAEREAAPVKKKSGRRPRNAS